MDWVATGVWVDLAQWAVTVAVGLYVWVTGRQRASQAQIAELAATTDRRLTTHGERLVRLEEQLRHLPDDVEIKALTAGVAGLQGDMKGLSAEMKGLSTVAKLMQRQIETMDEWLRKAAREGR